MIFLFADLLLPGTTGNVSLFVTIVNDRLQMYAQAQQSLRDIDPYVLQQNLSLAFSEVIVVWTLTLYIFRACRLTESFRSKLKRQPMTNSPSLSPRRVLITSINGELCPAYTTLALALLHRFVLRVWDLLWTFCVAQHYNSDPQNWDRQIPKNVGQNGGFVLLTASSSFISTSETPLLDL